MIRIPHFENAGIIYDRLKLAIAKRTVEPLYPIGLAHADEIARGYHDSKVSVIASRTSEGKTSLSLQSAVGLAKKGKTVAYISLEDDREGLVERALCNRFSIDNYDLAKGKMEWVNEFDTEATELFENLSLIMLDRYGYNFKEFKSVVMDTTPKPDIVFFDYLQLIEYPAGQQYDTLARFLRDAHQLANQERIGIVINSQINRDACIAKRPHLHNLKLCGVMEEVAYLVMILHQCYKHDDHSFDYDKAGNGYKNCPQDYTELLIEKNKTGRTGICRLKFQGQHYRFAEWKYYDPKITPDYS